MTFNKFESFTITMEVDSYMTDGAKDMTSVRIHNLQ